MDLYQYYLRRMSTAKDTKLAIQSCRDMAMRLFESGPFAWSIESGACLLSALHEINTNGFDIVPIFEEVEQALATEIQGVRLDIEADLQMKIRNTGCGKSRNGKRRLQKGGKGNV